MIVIVYLLVCLHYSWVLSVVGAISFDAQADTLSYGQLLSVCAPIPSLFSFFKLVRDNWREIGKFLYKIPTYFFEGLCFIITGWTDGQREKELNRDYFQWSKWRWSLILSGWLAYGCLHGIWVWTYVKSGTQPNTHNPTNTPHDNWKPFSVSR